MISIHKAAFLPLLFVLFCSCVEKKPAAQNLSIGTIETIHSEILDEDRTVWIHVPDATPPDSVRYQVLYLMDGDTHFKSVVGLMHQLSSVNGNNVCPKMIVVGILNTNRMRDLTPSKRESKPGGGSEAETGGGEAFTDFIADELIPFVENNYPASKQRTLIGHSLGGLMAIHTMIRRGDLFDKYVAIDPSLWWNDQKLLREYQRALATNDLKGKSLYIGIANTINMDTVLALRDTTEQTSHFRSINNFIESLKETPDSGLDWHAKYYPDDTHGSVPMISEYDAFHFLYRKIPIHMERAKLEAFEGKYAHRYDNEDLFLMVEAKENSLGVTEAWRNVKMEFLPTGENDFYCFQTKYLFQFKTDSNGEVVELVAFGSDVWKKVE